MNAPTSPDKFRRYRDRQKARGLKELRLWLADTAAPQFRAEASRQAALLRGAPEETEAMDFIEALAADDQGYAGA